MIKASTLARAETRMAAELESLVADLGQRLDEERARHRDAER